MITKKNSSNHSYQFPVVLKSTRIFFLLVLSVFLCNSAASQNGLINILTQNNGITKKDQTIFLEITITNTDALSPIGIYKLRPQINIPPDMISIADTGHVLPPGWTIIKNNGSGILLSNGTAILDPSTEHTILIAIRGKKAGGPSTIIGQLSFSDGRAPGTGIGFLQGDDQSDNSSTTTVKVVK